LFDYLPQASCERNAAPPNAAGPKECVAAARHHELASSIKN
jgi:hypothetical protein